MSEQERLPLLHRQGVEYHPYFLRPIRADLMLGRCRERNLPVFDDGTMAAVAGHQGSASVGQDLEEPGVKPGVLAEPGKTVMDPHERILHGLFSVLLTPQHVPGEPEAAWVVVLHELDERLIVASLGADREGRIEVVHRGAFERKQVCQITP